jgi:2,3-bisphosphoglycerate-independent phosphoglycerate mutase
MKYLFLVGDGMADLPLAKLGGRTPLEAARTPAMDAVAAAGVVGRVATVPQGLPPGSDVANLALMGYDPARYYRGRAPIEAASLGVPLAPDEVALRCNLVTLADGLMADYSAGHIDTADARDIISELKAALDAPDLRLYPGVSYRHLAVVKGVDDRALTTTPPHDISGKPWGEHLPTGPGSPRLVAAMETARVVLAGSVVNARRHGQGKGLATDIWLWGQGRAVPLPTLKARYGLSGSVVSAVDLVKGLGLLAGLTVRAVAGATGYLGTNYAGKMAAAALALASEDFVYLHVEAPDETSHEGDLAKKIQAIEEFDRHIVAESLALRSAHRDLRILVAPDHATPVSTRTHASGAVPFAVCGSGIARGAVTTYSEKSSAGAVALSGEQLFEAFIRGSF